ncbi:Mce-associated membrane protein [Mycobacterium sp. MAA66]|uniref:hypothetical protein n=1 Tax=Mycobacterium sp. MAA66 TaxID=3156297 RepID=UPI003513BF9A
MTAQLETCDLETELDAALAEHEAALDADESPSRRKILYGVMAALTVLLVAAAGYLGYQRYSASATDVARTESVQTASGSTVALLSYQPDSAERTLGDARRLLTGSFLDAYTSLIHDVVIPGAKQKHIASVATVPAAASVSADAHHAVVLVYVNQTITVGSDAPSQTASCIRVSLDKIDGRWLISQFDPI